MIIDMHAHLGPGFASPPHMFGPLFPVVTADQLIARLDQAGIDLAVVFPPRWTGGAFFDPNYEHANAAIADAIGRFPRRLIGFARVNPKYGVAAVRELERDIREYRFRGLKLDPETEWFSPTDLALLEPLMELCQALHLILLVHCSFHPAQPALFLPLAERWPDVRIVLGHMGLRVAADAIIAAGLAPNLYLETSGETPILVKRAIQRLGRERVLFGTDLPYNIPEAELEKIRLLPTLTEEDRSWILGRSAAGLLGLDGG